MWRRFVDWQRDLGARTLERGRVIAGNAVALLIEGIETYPAMLAAIAAAEHSVVLTSYIFAADATGARFRDALAAAARRAVRVRVLVDGFGSFATSAGFFAPLVEAGGALAVYRPPIPWRHRWGFWRRDHRKILVVDEDTAFIGGLNIGDDYAPLAEGGRGWHDTHAVVRGPAATVLARLVNRTWRQVTGDSFVGRAGPVADAGRVRVQVLENRFGERARIRRAHRRAFRHATTSICITNSYFIPGRSIRRALLLAARRGVRVQLLLAGRTDLPAVRYASRALYSRFMHAGIEIYEWTENVLHAKTAVVDGRWCSIGSANMDHRSVRHNLEANIVAVDEALGLQLQHAFRADLARALRIDRDSWHRRPALDKMLEQLFYKLRFLL
ncbi:MAG: cardiolipin synthase B [Deltaproteobacteria bacterium]|nr:cardiolipin synthase B [Deltaproteobacteria bacterium]